MTIKECECKIKEFIEQKYECIFKGRIQVVELGKDIYNLRLTLNSFYVPLNITREGTIEDFFEYIKKDLAKRRLNLVEYYSGYKHEPSGNN